MSESSNSGGIGFFGIVFIVLMTLKLAEVGPVATWSWWWVTAPLWLPLGLLMGFLLAAGTVKAIADWSSRRSRLRAMYRD